MANWPFNLNIPRNTWMMIEADGFLAPVPGCVYIGSQLDGGIPLGSLGTGYFTLEGSGKIGFCSIYNDIVPPRRIFTDWLTIRVGTASMPLSTAEIAYWGHYPVADLVAQFAEKPLALGIRAFTPFIIGDADVSNMPAALFEVELHNQGTEPLEAELLLAFPVPSQGHLEQVALLGKGLSVGSDSERLRGVASVSIPPGESKRVRFVFAWCFPHGHCQWPWPTSRLPNSCKMAS